MSHTVKVTMRADQEIYIKGKEVNIHDIQTIYVDGEGLIVDYQPMTKQEPQMMICPKAKECNEFEDNCLDAIPHKKNSSCTSFLGKCPACIPVEPEPTCPECECPISKHDSDGCHELLGGDGINDRCNCKRTPADLKPAEPGMPLIEHPMSGDMQYDLAFTIGRNSQQASDMAWLPAHDQQVRKAFAEVVSICNQLIALVEHGDYSNGNVAQGIDEGASMAMRRLTELKAELAHIRAMAEEVSHGQS